MSRKQIDDLQIPLDLDPDSAAEPQPAPRLPSDSGPIDGLASHDGLDEILAQWQEADWIRPLDWEFARLVRTLCQEQGQQPAPLLVLLAALVSHQVGRGHVCLDLNVLLQNPARTLALPPDDAMARSETLPLATPRDLLSSVALHDCHAALGSSNAVGDGSRASPMVLDANRLYLRKFWRHEQRIADSIRHRLSQAS